MLVDNAGLTTPVLLLTMGFTLWGGLVLGPRRVVPFLLLFGPLLLPAYGVIDLPGLPQLDRVTAVTIPALVLLFATPRECWQRFRFVWPDAFLLLFVAWSVLCTALNQGEYAARAMGLKNTLHLVVPYMAGRLYLQQTRDLVALGRVLVPFVLVYFGMMAFEARMYPRFQYWLYGEAVDGLYRYGLYRPIVFAQNALELGHLMALFGVVLLALYRTGGEIRHYCGRLLPFAIVAACCGVFLTLSRGPALGLFLGGLIPLLFRRTGWVACGIAMCGVGLFAWLLGPGGHEFLTGLTRTEAQSETDQTLLYRFMQIEAFKPLVEASPIFGHGEDWERTEMKIIDGELLLAVLGFGYPGAILLCLFWLSCAWQIGQRAFARDNAFHHVAAHLAPVVGWLVFTSWGDSFMRTPHYVLLGGALGALASRRATAAEESHAPNPEREILLRYG